MKENLTPNISLNITQICILIDLYKLILLYYTKFKKPRGICETILHLNKTNTITSKEYLVLLNHFNSIPRPLDANQLKQEYYWNVLNIEKRIEFLKEIINNLQDELNLQTNDKRKINRTL